MNLSGVFTQGPLEVKRYLLDFTSQLALGETITGVVVNVTSLTDNAPILSFVITGLAIAPNGQQVVYFASGGKDQNQYNVQFLATTTLTQVWEDVVQYNVIEKLD